MGISDLDKVLFAAHYFSVAIKVRTAKGGVVVEVLDKGNEWESYVSYVSQYVTGFDLAQWLRFEEGHVASGKRG